MSRADSEAPAPEPGAADGVDERDREFLDYLIERMWHDVLRELAEGPANENEATKRAT